MHSLDVSPHVPGRLCAVMSLPSQLLYCDDETGKIHRVDCSTAPPTPHGEIPIVHNKGVKDMCTLGDLLVVTRGCEGVFAYTLDGGELKWRVRGQLPEMQHAIYVSRVTAVEQGHLFVYDSPNECVHVLSARDGTHLGVAMREWREGVEGPWTWHQKSKSLVVAYATESKDHNFIYRLAVFSRQQPQYKPSS